MSRRRPTIDGLLAKLGSLTQERLSQVEDFVDFLHHREEDRRLVGAAAKLAGRSFRKVWDNPDDAEYDRL